MRLFRGSGRLARAQREQDLLANGVLDLRVHYFLARDVTFTGRNRAEHLETISDVVAIPLEEALAWVDAGKINDGDSSFALLLAARRLRKP